MAGTNVQEIVSALNGKPSDQNTWLCHCPAHEDKNASLSISEKDGKILFYCHAGCTQEAVLNALKSRDLWPEKPAKKKDRIVATYDYQDEAGKLLFQVCRKEPKNFVQRRPDGKGGWVWNLRGVRRILYRLPELLEAEQVFIPEGEKDVNALVSRGLNATCNPGGAGKWLPEYSESLRGKNCILLPDSDGPGRAHVQKVAKSLRGKTKSIKILELPGLSEKGDVSNWLMVGHTKDELLALVQQAEPVNFENMAEENEEAINGENKNKTHSQILCEIAEGLETFCTPDSDVYAFIPVKKHIETWPVLWKVFRQWLVKRFFDRFEKPPGVQALSDALNVIEAKAQFSGMPQREVFLRVAEYGGKVYLDLCNETWQVVEISADGWQVINVSPVPFRRPPGLLPLPEPSKGDKAVFEIFKKYINLKSKNDLILLIAWLVGALRQEGDHVILVLQGPEGTGKTTAARLIKSIIDPNISSERSIPQKEEDFIIGASNNHITSFDNISGIQPWLADALCRLSTGGGFSTRRLYTNDEEKLFYARRPVLLTGINPMPNRNDLARRCIVLNLEPIQGQILDGKSLFEKFRKEVLPGMLGAFCTAVSAALRNEKMELKDLPSMASFTAWILRAEEALPWKPGAFRKAYNKNTKNIVEQAVDADPVSSAIQEFMADKESWQGTASKLLEELCEIVPEKTRKPKAWPKVPNMLSSKLKRGSSFLRQVGIEVKTGIKITGGKRLITLDKDTKKTATTATNENHSLKIQQKMSGDDSGDENKKDRHSHQEPENIEENKKSGDQSDDDSGDQIKRPLPNNYLKTLNKISRNGKSGDSGDSGDEMPTLSKDMEVFEI